MKLASFKSVKPSQKLAIWASVMAMAFSVFLPFSAEAAQITARKVTLSSAGPAATGVTYTFNFTVPNTTAVKSVGFNACTTAIGACTTPGGFSQGSSTIGAQPTGLGAVSGWTISTATAGELRILNATNATVSSGSQVVTINNVVNPTATNASFYMRITTYTDAGWTTVLDTGVVGASTVDLIVVGADVAESLTFTTGASGANCAAIAATSGTVALLPNPLSTGSTSTITSLLCATSNASSGYNIQYLATPFTSGPNTFANGYGVGGSAAALGTEEFGLKATYTSGAAGGAATAPYNGTNYAFNPSVATSLITGPTGPTAESLYTVTYSANVSAVSKSGSYSSTFNYICTALF